MQDEMHRLSVETGLGTDQYEQEEWLQQAATWEQWTNL